MYVVVIEIRDRGPMVFGPFTFREEADRARNGWISARTAHLPVLSDDIIPLRSRTDAQED